MSGLAASSSLLSRVSGRSENPAARPGPPGRSAESPKGGPVSGRARSCSGARDLPAAPRLARGRRKGTPYNRFGKILYTVHPCPLLGHTWSIGRYRLLWRRYCPRTAAGRQAAARSRPKRGKRGEAMGRLALMQGDEVHHSTGELILGV